MVPAEYPPQQKKSETVTGFANVLARSKAKEEKIASQLEKSAENEHLSRLMAAIAKSARLVNEDILREAGYMLPQSGNTHALLRSWIDNPLSDAFPVEIAKKLLERIPCNEVEREN